MFSINYETIWASELSDTYQPFSVTVLVKPIDQTKNMSATETFLQIIILQKSSVQRYRLYIFFFTKNIQKGVYVNYRLLPVNMFNPEGLVLNTAPR